MNPAEPIRSPRTCYEYAVGVDHDSVVGYAALYLTLIVGSIIPMHPIARIAFRSYLLLGLVWPLAPPFQYARCKWRQRRGLLMSE